MKLSKLEYLAMNNSIRRYVQKNLEFKLFKQFLKKNDIDLKGKKILDAGCGSGYSSELMLNELNPAELVAFDFMPEQIKLAERRGLGINFFVGSATNIDLPPDYFDAVFIFGVLHHIEDWAKGLDEAARVLKPGGVLLVEELGKFATRASNYIGFAHPKENRFNWKEFLIAMEKADLKILEKKMIVPGAKSYLCKKAG